MLSWQNIFNSSLIAADIEEELVNQGEDFRGGISRVRLFLSNEWKPCHGAIKSWPRNLRAALKSTFNFTEIVNNYWLKPGTVCQIVRFIS